MGVAWMSGLGAVVLGGGETFAMCQISSWWSRVTSGQSGLLQVSVLFRGESGIDMSRGSSIMSSVQERAGISQFLLLAPGGKVAVWRRL